MLSEVYQTISFPLKGYISQSWGDANLIERYWIIDLPWTRTCIPLIPLLYRLVG